ncbi:MAG TPA: efflux RND transporter periplasmic adaptor subunit [Victivallales bacterium]|nr:efflux RND transporter periplasmic adaptor subunit [Victivallales bacterium]
MKNKRKPINIAILLLVIILGVIFSIEYFSGGSKKKQNIYIGIQNPKVANIETKVDSQGNVKAFEPISYFTINSIKITKTFVQVGDSVKKNDPLFKVKTSGDYGLYSTLRSPIDGVVISAAGLGDTFDLASKTPVFKITDISKVLIVSQIPESKISKIKIGEKVNITSDFFKRALYGKVNWISSVAKTLTKSRSGMPYIKINIMVNNNKLVLKPGYSVNLKIVTASAKNALTLPITTVLDMNTKPYVYNIDANNVVHKKYVKVGIIGAYNVQVKDIAKLMKVITDPPQNMKAGEKLNPAFIKFSA